MTFMREQSRYRGLIATALLVLIAALALHCSNEGDDDDDDPCSKNSAPVLSLVHVTLDGDHIYDGLTIEPGNQIRFHLDYSDPDCNLSGGEIRVSWSGAEDEPVSQIFTSDSCQGEYPEQDLGFVKSIQAAGEMSYSMSITDQCQERSNILEGSIVASYAPKIIEASWSQEMILPGEGAQLQFKVCDPDNDLLGGAVYLYECGDLGPVTDPVLWATIAGMSEVADCDNPPSFRLKYKPKHSICVDMAVTDGLGNSSGRVEDLRIVVQ
jgi:hypothetical protein